MTRHRQHHDTGYQKRLRRERAAHDRDDRPTSPNRMALRLVREGRCSASILGPQPVHHAPRDEQEAPVPPRNIDGPERTPFPRESSPHVSTQRRRLGYTMPQEPEPKRRRPPEP